MALINKDKNYKLWIKVFIKTLAWSYQISVKVMDNWIWDIETIWIKNNSLHYWGLWVWIKEIILWDNFSEFKLRKLKKWWAISIMKIIFL
jgi:hypothetical protein